MTSDNTDISSFTQASNASIVNPGSTSKETRDNTDISSFTQASNASIVNTSSPITVSTTSTNITTTTTATATSSSIGSGFEMELSMDPESAESALFGISTSTMVTSRSTINSQLGSVLVPVDIHHGERDKSTESEGNSNHVNIVKRKKVQKVGRPPQEKPTIKQTQMKVN